MASAAQLEALRGWFTDHGGYVNPGVIFEHSEKSGVHAKATTDLEPAATFASTPHSLALSSLNALVDDSFTPFRNRGLPPEAIGYFYLMHQQLHKSKSFWKPYLDTLPQPELGHSTLFWFDEDDLAWLEDTDVLFTYTKRKEMHELSYKKGIATLEKSGIDPAPYTWELFKWAVTMFTSRSFSSRALAPSDSKYWAAYKSGPSGQRQTVLLDMSRTSAEDLDFPVLFPVLDIPNHSLSAKVDWAFDPGRFTIALTEGALASNEVCNNYGPKGNDELLLGYGFCLENNPNDKVLLTLKAPPEQLQEQIRAVQPGYFNTSGAWASEKATFGLKRVDDNLQNPIDVFDQLPAPLLELMAYMVRYECGLPFEFLDHPRHALIDESSSARHYLPHITRNIVTSLAPKLNKIQSASIPPAPANFKQQCAEIYRNGQIEILESVIVALRTYLRSLLRTEFAYPEPLPTGPFITTLDGLLELLGRHSITDGRKFVDGIVANAGSSDLVQLRAAGWEEDIFVLLICYCEIVFGWDLPEYSTESSGERSAEELEQAKTLLELVRTAAEEVGESVWSSDRWNEHFIARIGGRKLVFESFMMMVPTAEGEDVARPVVYIEGSNAVAYDEETEAA